MKYDYQNNQWHDERDFDLIFKDENSYLKRSIVRSLKNYFADMARKQAEDGE